MQYRSFQRQAQIYGFQRIHYGANKGGYIHDYFRRDNTDLCDSIGRRSSGSSFPGLNYTNNSMPGNTEDEHVPPILGDDCFDPTAYAKNEPESFSATLSMTFDRLNQKGGDCDDDDPLLSHPIGGVDGELSAQAKSGFQ